MVTHPETGLVITNLLTIRQIGCKRLPIGPTVILAFKLGVPSLFLTQEHIVLDGAFFR